MDAPPIQYCRTDDGVSIAYWTLGEGRPLIATPPIPGSHLVEEWAFDDLRHWYEAEARHRQLVRYDPRGFGLSDRTTTTISLETHIHDLATVITELDAGAVDVFGQGRTSGAAMAYTARHPELVAHLLVFGGVADGGALAASPAYAAVYGMLRTNFEAYSEAIARSVFGWSADTELVREWAKLFRQSGTPEMITAAHDAMAQQNVTPLLADITVPTLIMQDESGSQFSLESAQDIARRIPDARLTVRRSEPGTTPWSWIGGVVETFLSKDSAHVGGAAAPVQTLLFTDLESSTALTQSLGDARAQEILHGHNDAVRAALAAHEGEEVKHLGDAITAARKYGHPFTFTPVAKFWLAANHLPSVRDDTDGFWRRIRLIPFRRAFAGSALNPHLEAELRTELPGILAWAVRGSQRWAEEGLHTPVVVIQATQLYRKDSDPLGEFILEQCVLDAEARIPARALFDAYIAWSSNQGLAVADRLSSRDFGVRLSRRFRRVRRKHGRTYEGLTLRSESPTHAPV